MADIWNPQQYEKFSDHRQRPFADLTSRVGATAPDVVVDLGCGPGPLTLSLASRWPEARIIGVDSSVEMLDQARSHDRAERVEWVHGDVESWDPTQAGAPIDVIVTNALLQWVPSHRQLIPGWIRALAPGGWFAMQVPGNFNAPSHALLREVAAGSLRAAELLLRLRSGEKTTIRVRNDLDEVTTTHWHGLILPADVDGGPHQAIAPGALWTASFTVANAPSTCWFCTPSPSRARKTKSCRPSTTRCNAARWDAHASV